MLRTKLSLSQILPGIMPGLLLPGLAVCCALAVTGPGLAGPPRGDDGNEPDYEASGFVVPAGYPQMPAAGPGMGPSGMGPGMSAVMQAGAPYGQVPMYNVQQAGFFGGKGMLGSQILGGQGGSSCSSGVCDGGCGGQCGGGGGGYGGQGAGCGNPGCGGCGHGSGLFSGLGCGSGGLFSRLGCGMGCGSHQGGLSNLRHLCVFCRGSGCGVCQSMFRGHCLGALAALKPYTEAGIGAQRWYDVSAEALFLSMDGSANSFDVTSDGVGPGNIVLRSGDAYNSDLEAGVRLSAAIICGVGGNLEVTYMGVNNFGGSASAPADGGMAAVPTYNSFISNFGTAPPGGYDDTDNSLFQGVTSESRFHSGEFNYRRRWVGPYSRFQGSWLAGVRHVDFDDRFAYRTIGLNNDTIAADDLRFFNSRYKVSNAMTGFQLGTDLWWNIHPGINLGVGWKSAVMGNVAKMRANIESNSIPNPGLVAVSQQFAGSVKDSDTAWLNEFNATVVYRLSYSCSFRSSYYLIGIEDVAFGSSGLETTTFNDLGAGIPTPTLAPLSADDSLTLSGFSLGMEYLW